MDGTAILIWIAIGIIAGWLASVIVGGGGLVRYLITGLIGAFVGGFLFKIAGINLNLGNPYVTEIVVAAIGAIVVVLIARLLAR
ncbi:GlsB/YeaQ/YmgE family stress response membrane protein [Roseibium marinum]|uniref:Transglycosylase associated protein n=1 Tax=Roseibium marinum TaxID=281252 RepID=A0A2S3URG4_9HYPH|nr:GlsB/YeaQ/YmgE family stress response membrane protein [Roseibium marinum]POF30079.1 transglycosylase associated protein [Roseibium marinum]